MAKYTLELNEEQARTVAQACEFFARIKMGQFQEIPYLLLSNELSGADYCSKAQHPERAARIEGDEDNGQS